MSAKKIVTKGAIKLMLVLCLTMLNMYVFAGVTITPEGATCVLACDGKVTISISGPDGPYEVRISSSYGTQTQTTSGTATFTDLCTGPYSVSVQAENCDYSGSFKIPVDPDNLQLDFDIQNEVCKKRTEASQPSPQAQTPLFRTNGTPAKPGLP
ncbi:MAG: hypothetical protein HC896_13525 [Bacteroidales bacterium]|nr:hypothetical protein [Bacteroidales bacterium]